MPDIEILLVVIIILVLTLAIYICIENSILKVSYYTLQDRKLPIEFHHKKILVLGDLHGDTLGNKTHKILTCVDTERPDYIFITGDMLTNGQIQSLDSAKNLVCELVKKYPVYYAPGNHEEKMARYTKEGAVIYDRYVKSLTDAGVVYLDNAYTDIESDGQSITIWGLNLELEYYAKVWNKKHLTVGDMDRYLSSPDAEQYHILLAHHPDYIETYLDWGADCVMSGHLHGGIVRFPFIGGVISPTFRLFPKIDGGCYIYGNGVNVQDNARKVSEKYDGVLFLTKGLGTHTIPIRMGNPPEIMCITLDAKSKKK